MGFGFIATEALCSEQRFTTTRPYHYERSISEDRPVSCELSRCRAVRSPLDRYNMLLFTGTLESKSYRDKKRGIKTKLQITVEPIANLYCWINVDPGRAQIELAAQAKMRLPTN